MDLAIISLLKLAGVLQIILCIGSLAIPRLLNWKAELGKVSRITAQVFWTYAGYILMINLSFGLVSVFGAEELITRTFLSRSITIFIFLYWLTRVLIQFFYFDKTSVPKGLIYIAGEIALVILFIFLTGFYGWVAYYNFS